MEMIGKQYYHMYNIIKSLACTKFPKNLFILVSYYLNQAKLCLTKSFIWVESNDDNFIKMDLLLAKLFIFVINYLFSEKKLYLCNLWFKPGEIIPK